MSCLDRSLLGRRAPAAPRRSALAGVGLAVLAACGSPPVEEAPEPALADRLRWTGAVPAALQPVGVLPAEVVSDSAGEAWLGPGIDGRILRWRVGPGTAVDRGAPLAEVESADLTTLSAEVRELRAAEARTAELRDLAESAREAGVGTAQEVAQAVATHSDVASRLAGARARLSARRGAVEGGAGGWVWTAPSAGVVDAVTCAEGPVSAGDRCLRLLREDGGTTVEVHAPERLLPALEPLGPAVVGRWLGADGSVAELRFLAAAPALEPATRQLRLRFSAPAGSRVGASGRVELQVPGEGLARVPAEALVRVGGAPHLFVREPVEGADLQGVPADDPVAWLAPVERVGASGDAVVVRWAADPPPQVATAGTFLLKSLTLREAP
jgi:cobalt-zinc-cadmium efflux system membrane fusion protein